MKIEKLLEKIIKVPTILFAACMSLGIAVSWIEKARGMKGYVKGHKSKGVYERNVKRVLDFGLSLFALLILSPVILLTAILVRWKLGSPVLFKQARPGLGGSVFIIKKFRTMTDGRDSNGRLLPDKLRLPPFGEALRRASIDELPELLNIIAGDMSIIGPRPLLPKYLPYFTKEEGHRHDVRPGLTGLAQINGRNNLSWDQKLKLDVDYCNNITFPGDLKILLHTVKKVLKKEDIVVRGTGGSVLDFDVERKMQMENEG